MKKLLSKAGKLLRFFVVVLLGPWRLFMSVRRSMTGASVTILLIGIITLNIVWGYPWTGMFAASVSLLVVGWVINRLMRPRLNVSFSLPASSPAGDFFSVVTHLENRSPLPAMDMAVRFAQQPVSRKQRKKQGDRGGVMFESSSPAQSVALIHHRQHVDLSSSVMFGRRGVHPLPVVVVHSMFPFHLFRSTQKLPSNALVAITPKPISGDEDALARGMLSALGAWSHKLLSGDALDYTGSREYQHGMAVRRWDFASWARLGRPIVREYQSPSVQTVLLLVDTSDPSVASSGDQSLERLFSLAATAVIELTRKLVRVQMYVTHEDADALSPSAEHGAAPSTDAESFLIRLAAAHRVDQGDADRSIQKVLEQVGKLPVLVLTLRQDASVWENVASNVTVLRADLPHHDAPPPASRRPRWQSSREAGSTISAGGP